MAFFAGWRQRFVLELRFIPRVSNFSKIPKRASNFYLGVSDARQAQILFRISRVVNGPHGKFGRKTYVAHIFLRVDGYSSLVQ